MKLVAADPTDARAVLRGLRAAVNGAGPAIALGGVNLPSEVPSGTAVVLTTSGSTGQPKSVVLNRAALTASALATTKHLGDGRWLLCVSPSYIAGVQVLVRSLVSGHEPALLSGSFSAQAFAAAAAGMASVDGSRRIPLFTAMVPAQLATLVDAAETATDVAVALASFDAILIGGQALAPALAERAAAVGARIVRTYGSTETSGGCVYDGVALPDVTLRIRDGEVQISGPTLAEGYLDEGLTAAVFTRDDDGTRWYRTGDAGSLENGILRVSGRLDNVIISGGINVSLDRVERVIQSVAGLASAVVVGVADERWGQASVIAVEASALPAGDPEGTALLVAARDAVAAVLGAPARPRDIAVLEHIPRLVSAKPDRRALATLLAR